MVGSALLGSGGFSDGYEVGAKRERMMDPYFATSSYHQLPPPPPYNYGGAFPSFPVVRLRGLPFNCSDVDIFKFFSGLDVIDVLLVNKNGRFTGDAFAVFTNTIQSEIALQRDHVNMGRRYVEVFRSNKQEYYRAVAAEVKYEGIYDEFRASSPPAPKRAKKSAVDKEHLEYTDIIKMRGLPYSVTKSDIVEFLEEFEVTEDNVHIGSRPDGKATGEAYVEFESVDDAKRAIMEKDRMTIGSRYVEIFPSTPDEFARAKSRSRH
ncbi:hypothetical protein ACHQM5_015850 [Ranunculus cassubicifolius]